MVSIDSLKSGMNLVTEVTSSGVGSSFHCWFPIPSHVTGAGVSRATLVGNP